MSEQELIENLALLGITGAQLLKVGGVAFGMVLGAFFMGWKIGIAISLIRKM